MSLPGFFIKAWRRNMKRARVLRRWILTPFAYVYVTCEFLFFLILHRRVIKNAKNMYSLWFWSFGHQATDLHMLSLRFPEKDLLVLISDYQNFNRSITDSFKDHCTLVYLPHTRLMYACWKHVLGIWPTVRWKQRLIVFFLRVIGGRANLIRDYHTERGPAVAGIYLPEYMRLVNDHADIVIRPDEDSLNRARNTIASVAPDVPEKPIVALYLRKKRAGVYDVRDTDPAPYEAAVRMLLERGVTIFCGGDYGPADILPHPTDGVYGYEDFPCTRGLLDFYFLTQADFMLGAHSGPLPVCMAFGVPVLITNNAFYYLTGYKSDHRLLNKKLIDKKTGRELSAKQLFSYPVVAYNQTVFFERAGLLHVDNTAEEILAATKEMAELVFDGKDDLSPEDEALVMNYRSLLPAESVAHQSPARPVLSYLRGLRWE